MGQLVGSNMAQGQRIGPVELNMDELVSESESLATFASSVMDYVVTVCSKLVGPTPPRPAEKIGETRRGYDGYYSSLASNIRQAKFALEAIKEEVERL